MDTKNKMETKIYNQKGAEAGKISLPEHVFGLNWNADLVHQVVMSMLSSARKPVAHTKTRGEVRGGGIKPWQQKGTGRARHGSIRSPLWVGGGVTHGPRNDKNYERKVSKKMKAKALFTILSRKMKEGEILFIDKLVFATPKTQEAVNTLKNFSGIKGFEKILLKRNNSAYIAIGAKDYALEKSFSNINNVVIDELRNINPVDIVNYKYLVITNPQESVNFIASKMEASSRSDEKSPKIEKKEKKTVTKKVASIKTVKTKVSSKK